jgi:hypothetical protein
MTEPENSSEISVYFCQTSPRRILEDSEVLAQYTFCLRCRQRYAKRNKKELYLVAVKFVGLKTTEVSVTGGKTV